MMGPSSLDVNTLAFGGLGAGVGTVGSPPSSPPPTSGATAAATGQGVPAGSEAQTVVAVYSQVDALLASFGPELAGDQQLRMIIALLILSALLGSNDENRTLRPGELAGLASLTDPFTRQPDPVVFSATNTIQIEHQSVQVYSNQAVQSLSGADAGSDGGSGSRVDVTV